MAAIYSREPVVDAKRQGKASMPRPDPDISRKKQLERSQRQGDSPPNGDESQVNEVLAQTFQQHNTILSGGMRDADRMVLTEGMRIRREAEARQATIQARDLAIQQAEALQQLRKESDAATRMARVYFWWGLVASIVVAILSVLVGWLLAH
jgi:hypothetical protein